MYDILGYIIIVCEWFGSKLHVPSDYASVVIFDQRDMLSRGSFCSTKQAMCCDGHSLSVSVYHYHSELGPRVTAIAQPFYVRPPIS